MAFLAHGTLGVELGAQDSGTWHEVFIRFSHLVGHFLVRGRRSNYCSPSAWVACPDTLETAFNFETANLGVWPRPKGNEMTYQHEQSKTYS